MAKGRVQGVTYTQDRIIVGFFHTSFKGFFTISTLFSHELFA
jgi:hypothetical protein